MRQAALGQKSPGTTKNTLQADWITNQWGIFIADAAANPRADVLAAALPAGRNPQLLTTVEVTMTDALQYLTTLLDCTWCDSDNVMLLEDLNSRYDRYMHKNYLSARDMY